MSTVGTARNACAGSGAFLYQRHRPEKTLLYQLVSKHYPVFRQQLFEEGRILPDYVQREFEDYLKCGRLEHGFIPGILPSTPSGPAFGCSNRFQTYLSAGTMRDLSRGTPGCFRRYPQGIKVPHQPNSKYRAFMPCGHW